MAQALSYLIIQDGSSLPLILGDGGMRRSRPYTLGGDEVPVGTVMAYSNGRLWVALEDRQSFMFGDLAYSITGTEFDVLTFTENELWGAGGAFVVPNNAGPITAMRPITVQDTTTGQGPLQVFTSQGSFSVDAPFAREDWINLQSPIVTISMIGSGASSQNAAQNVNGDIWYRARDGVRSFVVARRDHGTWVNTPLSREVDRILNRDTEVLLEYSSAALFDNRLLITCSPYRAQETDGTMHGVAHRGLVALDFRSTASMLERSQPVWEGLWTGLQILQLVPANFDGMDYLFIFTLNADNEIEMWEMARNARFDSLDNPIEWGLESRAFQFIDQGWSRVRLQTAEMWVSKLFGNVDFDLKFRPDQSWNWQDYHTWSKCASKGLCAIDCTSPTPFAFPQNQYRPRTLLPIAPNDCETAAGKPYREGFEFQVKLTMTGACQLHRMRLSATQVAEQSREVCPGEEVCVADSGCETSPFSYVTTD
jgi:hypothetical protein